MSRRTFTSTDVMAGCFECRGSEAMWTAANAMALAARHHDSTGHATWSEQHLTVRHGDYAAAVHPDLFADEARP